MQQRQGHQAVEKLRETLDEKYLWEVILLYAGESFKTYTGLPFTYEVRKGRNGDYTRELWIDRSALYELPTQKGSTRCIIHPVCKQQVRRNTVTEYAADMNVLLTYYKCRDDWEDEKKVTALGYSKVLQGKVKKLDQKYPDKSRRIQKLLSELSEMEKSGEKDIDKMAGCFGKIMEEIFAWKQDVWEDTLRRMGFFLGKFIYLLDAYDDVEEDIKNKNYNPFSEQYIIEGFDEQVRRILIMMMAQTCREFEKLPIIKYTDILRNILYSGVWCRFEVIHKKRKEAGEKDND